MHIFHTLQYCHITEFLKNLYKDVKANAENSTVIEYLLNKIIFNINISTILIYFISSKSA